MRVCKRGTERGEERDVERYVRTCACGRGGGGGEERKAGCSARIHYRASPEVQAVYAYVYLWG